MAHAVAGALEIRQVVALNCLLHRLNSITLNLGLPFHNHGRTWLAVVHGAKRWFVYPPGYGPPPELDDLLNPLLPVSAWLSEVYPLLQQYPKPPMYAHQSKEAEEDRMKSGAAAPVGYRPLECLQRPGEVVAMPDRWAHMTVNVGETVAIGGQELLTEKNR